MYSIIVSAIFYCVRRYVTVINKFIGVAVVTETIGVAVVTETIGVAAVTGKNYVVKALCINLSRII